MTRHIPRCLAAACGNHDKAPTTTTTEDMTRSVVGRKFSVRKRTWTSAIRRDTPMVWPPHHDWLFFQKGKYLVTHRLRFHAKTFIGCLPRGPRAAPQPIGASVLASTNPAALGLIPHRRATPHLHTVHETIVESVMRPSSLQMLLSAHT